MEAVSERELVERCRRGDERAFQELVEGYKNLVFALIARTAVDRSRVEDLAQDVFVRVYRGLPYFRGEARLATWIYRIVANVCAQERPPDRTRPLEEAAPHLTSAADRQFSDLELRDRLEKAIARLPANYRLLVAAHYLDGIQYEDLAEALQMPLGTVKTQLYRAKQQLRRLLQEEQFLDTGFNVAVALLGVATTAGAILMVYATGLGAVGQAVVDLFASAAAELARRIAPSLPLYGAATALIASALGIWWWAEKELRL